MYRFLNDNCMKLAGGVVDIDKIFNFYFLCLPVTNMLPGFSRTDNFFQQFQTTSEKLRENNMHWREVFGKKKPETYLLLPPFSPPPPSNKRNLFSNFPSLLKLSKAWATRSPHQHSKLQKNSLTFFYFITIHNTVNFNLRLSRREGCILTGPTIMG
jgi:hypothetical protein